MQSHEGFVRLLPALPKEWSDGSFRGLRARGGFIISAEWKNNRLTAFEVSGEIGGDCEVRYKNSVWKIHIQAGETRRFCVN